MTTKTIHDNRIADVIGRPAARLVIEIPQPSPPMPEAVVTYYVDAGANGGTEREALYLALKDYARVGWQHGTITALATIYDANGEPECQWKCEYREELERWGAWK
ncbi:MAG: hypothetical protein EKK55_07830 [Rhodocyclaceae bacterium]|nr:MAG: hypothetical protein EKK55_07830 [Rhodocyclaceae bacterium]